MWTSTFLFLLYFLTVSYVLSDGTYECGDHGKFEYCIDEIPGCVIGCHCHPGYYFDTDTKICEPNSKLIEHHRRHYADEQTSIQSIVTTPMFEIDSVSTSKINSKVNQISKDANDLGDWLYNQFFKTIENQVINNTSDKNIPTRRSGSRQAIGKPKRKKGANRGKPKQRKKKQSLKKELLRITENDSLFDMTSRSDSDSSDDSSSDSSFEYERRDDHHDSDNEHGHKKIVMINKKPKPALPSFIFLPNMDTPFYPPIGLPPPPVVPMYPIIPVPPVVPFYVTTDCISDNGKTTSSPTTTTTTTTVTTESEMKKNSTVQNTDKATLTEINEPTISTNTPLVLRLPGKKRKKESRLIENDENNENINNFGLSNLKPSTRQKFLKRLKERMSNPSAKFLMPPWKKNKQIFLETFAKDRDNEASIFENALLDDSYLGNNIHGKTSREELPPENVDFKYITELIHKVDLKNKSNHLPPIEYSPSNSIEMYQPQYQQNQFSDYIMPPNEPDGRRYNRPGNQQSEDSYYMKLGREIASMIRGIDEQNREAKLGGLHDNLKNAVYFNENSPRSYWERSVRSPLTFLKSNKSKFEYLKKSNELLFDIENKVEIVASTRPTLSLQEIENIVKIMETTKKEVKRNKESSNKNVLLNNLNIKLWPQELRNPNKIVKNSLPNSLDKKQVTYIQNPEGNKSNEVHQINDKQKDTRGIRMHNIHRFVVWRKPISDGDMKPDKMVDMNPKIKPEIKSYLSNPPINYNKSPPYEIPNHKQVKPVPVSKDNFRQSLMEGNMGSVFFKHRKYFDSNQNHFVNPPGLITRKTQPSYFHHEIDHFDYVE